MAKDEKLKVCHKHTSRGKTVVVQYSFDTCPFCDRNKEFKKYRQEAKRIIKDAGRYCGV